MANADRANGFKPVDYIYPAQKWPLTASQTIAVGDMVYLDSAGRVSLATSSTSDVMGVAQTSCSSSTAGDDIHVYDHPMQHFDGQCGGSTGGALADPYTCVTLASCFDLTGTTGIQEIDEDNSTYDIIKVIGVGTDPNTGEESATGANQRKIFVINPTHHQLWNPA